MNALQIIKSLIAFESVTPLGHDCLAYIGEQLEKMNFSVEIVKYGPVYNMFAKLEKKTGPHLCFAGHVDVVPPGNLWTHNPYELQESDDHISGVGIVDMKGAIGCFIAMLHKNIDNINGSVSIMLTTDEEGDAVDGLKKYMQSPLIQKQHIDLFILGEPTCYKTAGDAVKLGRRGSVTATLSLEGAKGHIAYPEFANSSINPISDLIALLHNQTLGEANEYFEATKIQISGINTPEQVENVIPGNTEISFGTRFNSNYSGEEVISILSKKINDICNNHKIKHSITWKKHGEPFIVTDKSIIGWLKENIQKATNSEIDFNANGATSDGRFLTKLGPVVEIGLEESEAHQTGEKTCKDNIPLLCEIYSNLLLNLDKLPIQNK